MTDILCSILDFFTSLISKYFPSLSLAPDQLNTISNAFKTVVEFMAQINFIVPLPTMFMILSIVYGIKAAKFSIFLVNWCIRRIRGG